MAESIKPIGEDFYSSMEDLADFAGEVALDVYQKALDDGFSPTEAVSDAIEAATNVMLDSGCPKELCDALSRAAINGFSKFMDTNPNCDPMEAFNVAGECINEFLES